MISGCTFFLAFSKTLLLLFFIPIYATKFSTFCIQVLRNQKQTFKSKQDFQTLIALQADWMDPITKANALHKAVSMQTHVGYPDELLDDKKLEDLYEKLEIGPDDYLHSYLNVTSYFTEYSLDLLTKPINKSHWVWRKSPVNINAYYYEKENSLEFSAALLQDAFFNNNRPQYMNYGAIGLIIGHEITHGFDDHGRQHDYKGDLVDWWEQETAEKFQEKADCIIRQYDNYFVEEVGMNLNGNATQGENIADIGGTKLAYLAYKEWIKRNGPAQKLFGLDFTTTQLFWISAAQPWCTKERPESLKSLISEDPHSPEEFRVNGAFSNQIEFAKDFNCSAGSNMNRDEKCQIW